MRYESSTFILRGRCDFQVKFIVDHDIGTLVKVDHYGMKMWMKIDHMYSASGGTDFSKVEMNYYRPTKKNLCRLETKHMIYKTPKNFEFPTDIPAQIKKVFEMSLRRFIFTTGQMQGLNTSRLINKRSSDKDCEDLIRFICNLYNHGIDGPFSF